ncbi:MAG: DNA methyltransferase [Planctomycetota bacterium]
MNAAQFITKWSRAQLSERAASQEHFLDLCRLLGQPTPAGHDATGAEYAFEKGVAVSGSASKGSKGAGGFADVWWKGKFGWEYKRKGKYATLNDAYRQLCQYREALANPPLLIVSDITRTEIRTNFTGFKTDLYTIDLQDLTDPGKLDTLRRVFADPQSFKPDETAEQVTEKAAKAIGRIAHTLRDRGHDPHDTAHFLMKVMFCLFAEDVNLLPKGLFERLLTKSRQDPVRLKSQMDQLFAAMRTGGDFGIDEIAYFNGGLFDQADALELTEDEIAVLVEAADKDWGAVEPSVFGTLFERSLDPAKRSQIGAHYTSRDDIMLVIEPVILRPLRKQWDETRAAVEDQIERRKNAKTAATKRKADAEIADLLDAFQARLAEVRVLDPACGSGNFLYVAIQQLLALEKELILFAAREDIGAAPLPRVRPNQLLGIEINPYAAELAQVVIWIGYLQWMRDNGFNAPRNPILEPLKTIENRDAILAWEDEDGNPIPTWREGAACRGQAEWPAAEFIVGNPPFLGGKFMRNGIGGDNTEAIHAAFDLPNFSDLCCYWFEIARQAVLANSQARVGLLATQGIRGGANRAVLSRIVESLVIFDAWADEKWILDGAAVHISIVCFATSTTDEIMLNGVPVPSINADLTTAADVASATMLPECKDIGFIGVQKSGPFDLEWSAARPLLATPNPIVDANFKVVRPSLNASMVTRRPTGRWIINFPVSLSQAEASSFEAPFQHCVDVVKPARKAKHFNNYPHWVLWRPRPELFDAADGLDALIVTPHVSKHRLFVRLPGSIVPDNLLIAFARSDDYFFGILHSAIHELWARRQGTQLREAESGFRYTPTTCFETFPLPWPPGAEPDETDPLRPLHHTIADAAKTLNEQRERWLNPPEWIAEIAERIDAEDDFADVSRVSGDEARRLIRQSAIDAAAAKHPKLKKRTLTNLYNERPTWLRLAHRGLDEAVLAAYAATDPEGAAAGDWDASWAEVFEQTGAGQPLPEGHELAERRAEVEQAILAALLRLNHDRAGHGPITP